MNKSVESQIAKRKVWQSIWSCVKFLFQMSDIITDDELDTSMYVHARTYEQRKLARAKVRTMAHAHACWACVFWKHKQDLITPIKT